MPVLASGVEFLGAYQGSGFTTPRYLLRRGDGQVAQLPWMLYRAAWHLEGQRDLTELAELLGRDLDREVSAEQMVFLLEHRLRPAGLVSGPIARPPGDGGSCGDTVAASAGGGGDGDGGVVDAGTAPGGAARGDHLLMLRMRKALVPEAVVWRIAGVFAPLFHRLVVLVALAGFVVVDVAVVAVHGWAGVQGAGQALIQTPTLTLIVLALIVAAGVFHECGHVAACRYGGATPGTMGVGVYIVWPAFYSTVTDAYRLPRAGRLRTDLGGVYFNAIVLAGLGGAYLVSGAPWLLAAIVVLHVETAWQFLPSLRLDGYYILADLVGVPDLFNRMRPILAGLFRRDHTDPRVADLKPWVRRVVTAWVVLVIPFLLYWVVLFVVLAPSLLPSAWQSLQTLAGDAVGNARIGQLAAAAVDILSMALLVLPWASGAVLVGLQLRRLLRAIRRAITRRRNRRRTRLAASPPRRLRPPRPYPPSTPPPDTSLPGASATATTSSASTNSAGAVGPAGWAGSMARTPLPRLVLALACALTVVAATAQIIPAVGAGAAGARPTSEAGPTPATGGPIALNGLDGPPTLYGRVVSVTDPHTVVVEVQGRPITVSVIGLDPTATPACAQDEATAFARRTLDDQTVTLVPDPTLPTNPDAATWPAYLVLADQQSYTDAAITAGWAGAGPGRYRPGFLTAERQAQDTDTGMWGPPCDRTPPP